MILRLTHARELGYCNKGIRAFCLRHNLDWRRFVTDGYEFSELSHINDAMLSKVMNYAKGSK